MDDQSWGSAKQRLLRRFLESFQIEWLPPSKCELNKQKARSIGSGLYGWRRHERLFVLASPVVDFAAGGSVFLLEHGCISRASVIGDAAPLNYDTARATSTRDDIQARKC